MNNSTPEKPKVESVTDSPKSEELVNNVNKEVVKESHNEEDLNKWEGGNSGKWITDPFVLCG